MKIDFTERVQYSIINLLQFFTWLMLFFPNNGLKNTNTDSANNLEKLFNIQEQVTHMLGDTTIESFPAGLFEMLMIYCFGFLA